MKTKTDTQKAAELDRLKEWVKKILPQDHDKFDTEAHYDSNMSVEENKALIREQLKLVIHDLKAQVDYVKAEQERIDDERKRKSEKEVDQYNSSLSFQPDKDLDEMYSPVYRGVNKLCQGFSNLLFIKGRGGLGKSYNIRRALILNKAEFIEIAGDVTEAYLYRLMFENNGKILWFKDTAKILSSLGSINLLKSACETDDNRVLTKSNYSKDQADLPDRFLVKCKFIFDYNNVFGSQLMQDFEALATRGDYRELAFSDDDIKKIMVQVAKEPWQKDVTEFVINKFEATGLVKLNLRTQWKAFRTYEYAKRNNLDWQKELEIELTHMSKIRALLYTMIGTKAVRAKDLKKLLLRQEVFNNIRTIHRKINEWLYLEELFKVSEDDRNFFVCINKIENQKLN